MKKALVSLVALIAGITAVFSFSACQDNSDKVKIIDIPLSKEEYAITIPKGHDELKAKIDEFVLELTGEGVEYEGKKITFDYLYETETENLANDVKTSIGSIKTKSTDRANELVIATEGAFPPFEYTLGDSVGGIDMQIAKLLAAKLNKTLVVLVMEFDSIIEELNMGNADIGIAGFTITEARKAVIDFSVPYYITAQYIAVQEHNTDFDECVTSEDVEAVLKGYSNGTKAGAARGQTGYFYLAGLPGETEEDEPEYEGFSNLSVGSYGSIALAVQALADGKIKLVCGDKDTLTAAVNVIG